MLDIKTLLPELKRLVSHLSEDLLQHGSKIPAAATKLQDEYQQYHEGGRISQSFEEWREDYLEQVAVAWVVACIFVRFIEDNELINEGYIAGEGERGKLAEGEYTIYFRHHPHDTDREYLKHVFEEIGKLPAAAEIFHKQKNPLWAVDLSGDAARHMIRFFQEIDPELGGLRRSFRTIRVSVSPIAQFYQDLSPQARFLGDLYQDLSVQAQKKYALKQTPEFIQQFILDRTLTHAIDEFGLRNLRLIDPACGSGHFLLGAFDQLFEEWTKPHNFTECNDNLIVAAQNAFDSIHGVDINPFAIAITRFRLFVAAVQACGINRLNQQTQAWKFNVAVGDSLLRGSRPDAFGKRRIRIQERQLTFGFEEKPQFPFEEVQAANEILDKGYHVVVGNPPYITVKDKSQNEQYRQHFRQVCHRQYSLGVPFTQRFWELAIRQGEQVNPTSDQTSPAAGYVGMITANSFMKREFGKKLIEEFFPKIDLTHVLDTSGAYIPGHGTPTVILFGRAQKPVGATVRAVLGIKGEPSTPEDPTQGMVWQSIVQQIDRADSQDDFVSSADVPRETFSSHPWSIGGGGAGELLETIGQAAKFTLGTVVESVGRTSVVGEDDCWIVERDTPLRRGFVNHCLKFGIGECFRDWQGVSLPTVIYPYKSLGGTALDPLPISLYQWLWPFRTLLTGRSVFGKSMTDNGKHWYEHLEHYSSKLETPLAIAFAFVATHNHFVLDRGGKVFNRTAPIIKFPAEATEEDHLALLGLLNSSTACFWLHQVCFPKDGKGEHWARRYEHDGGKIASLPLPESRPLELASKIDSLGIQFSNQHPEEMVQAAIPTADGLSKARNEAASIRGRMIALQEELDWECYRLYGLLTEDLCYPGDDLPELVLGQRAFEIVMARQMATGELETTWFERHGSKPITEIPADWPDDYCKLVQRRIEVIKANKEISLIEKPEYKRRWNTESWEDQQQRALKNWLLDRLESQHFWPDPAQNEARLQSVAELSDKASGDHDFLQVAAIYRGREDFDVAALVAELVESESVPFLPILRYKPAGFRKREVWEKTWELQRKEDALKDEGGRRKDEKGKVQPSALSLQPFPIPVPPKYTSADFLKTDYWRLRGKLDVPKERWISFPHCETESDPSLVVGWAGWNHLQQATAVIAYYDARKREGWDAKRLTPLLAGLDQLLPWIHQWHPEVDPEFGETAGQSFETMLKADAHELGLTLEDIRAWEPPAKKKGGRRKAAKGGRRKAEG